MKPIPRTPETEALARRLIWFEAPADPVRLLAYAFEAATAADIAIPRRHLTEDDPRAALAAAPPGIIRPRSRTLWHARFGQTPAPPLPKRRLG